MAPLPIRGPRSPPAAPLCGLRTRSDRMIVLRTCPAIESPKMDGPLNLPRTCPEGSKRSLDFLLSL
jgi:hypothetical protein